MGKQFGYLLDEVLAPFYETATSYLTGVNESLQKWRQNTDLVTKAQAKLASAAGTVLEFVLELEQTLEDIKKFATSDLGIIAAGGIVGYFLFGPVGAGVLAALGEAVKQANRLKNEFKDLRDLVGIGGTEPVIGDYLVSDKTLTQGSPLASVKADMEADAEVILSKADEPRMIIAKKQMEIQKRQQNLIQTALSGG